MPFVPLTAAQARVVGSLVEKQLTTPQQYPLTANALLLACNQSSNREPVTAYTEHDVAQALDELREQRLVRFVLPSHGRSVVRYRHVLDEVLGIDASQLAVVAVLLLRGPQTVGELRIRTERMAGFDDLGAVEHELDLLADREDPLVSRLPRRPGQKEERWAELLHRGAGAGAGGEGDGGPAGPGVAGVSTPGGAAPTEAGPGVDAPTAGVGGEVPAGAEVGGGAGVRGAGVGGGPVGAARAPAAGGSTPGAAEPFAGAGSVTAGGRPPDAGGWAPGDGGPAAGSPAAAGPGEVAALREEVAALRQELAGVRAALEELRASLGG